MDGTHETPVEQLRIALVLNGGVSLAIWMGGAAHEINRLTRRESHYAQLLSWVRSEARVDVISGTSAGGINGAALAVAQSNGSSLAPGLEVLRDVWVESGSFAALMRTPYQDGPPSLLKGDEYFLPQISNALRRLTTPFDPTPVSEKPIDLTITTTLLHGVPGTTVDSVGNRVARMRHDGLFRFRRGPTAPDQQDPFAADRLLPTGGTLDALALAARSTASYPVAFEPSFISMSGTHELSGVHPPMAEFVSGAWEDTTPVDRYVIDGGVLANTPTHPAIEAVGAMPARGEVRRVMLLVHPHAPSPESSENDTTKEPPTLVGLASGVLGALTSQGSRNYAEQVDAHNRAAGGRHLLRAEVVAVSPEVLSDQAQQAYHPWYVGIRSRRLARDLAELWLDHVAAHADSATVDATFQPTFEALQEELTAHRGLLSTQNRPWPSAHPELLGFEGALGVADAASDYLRREVGTTPEDRHPVELARTAVGELRNAMLRQRGALVAAVKALSGDLTRQQWLGKVTDLLVRARPDLRSTMEAIAGHVLTVVQDTLPSTDDPVLAHFRTVLTAAPSGDLTTASVLEQLNRIQLLTYVISDEVISGNALPVDLVQLSYQTKHPFAPFSASGAEKVAGDQLGRFSAFLKRSWRVNDWTWGRLDASRVLCQTVLQPDRVHRYLRGRLGARPSPVDLADCADALVSDLGVSLDVIGVDRARLIAEITRVYDGSRRPLVELPAVFAAALATEIARDELPELGRAIKQDIDEGGNRRSRGLSFVTRNSARLQALDEAPQPSSDGREEWTLLQEFDLAGVGREPLGDEATGDRLISTAVGAGANAVTVLDNPKAGLGALSPVTKGLRGASLLPYWAVTGLAGGSTARALSLLGLAAGGVLLVLGLLGVGPAGGAAVGTAVLLVVLAYAALRTGTMLHGVVLLVPVVPLVALAWQAEDGSGEGAASSLIATLLLVAGVLLLGSLREPVGSPLAWLRRGSGLHNWQRVLIAIVAALVVALLLNPTVRDWLSGLDLRLPVVPFLVVGLVLAVALAVWGVRTSLTFGRSLRLVEQTPEGWRTRDVRHPAGAAAGWAAFYGIALLAVVPLVMVGTGALWPASVVWQSTMVSCAVLGLLLVGLVPWRLQRRTTRALDARAGALLAAHPDRPAQALAAHGLNYARYLHVVDAAGGPRGVALSPRATTLLSAAR